MPLCGPQETPNTTCGTTVERNGQFVGRHRPWLGRFEDRTLLLPGRAVDGLTDQVGMPVAAGGLLPPVGGDPSHGGRGALAGGLLFFLRLPPPPRPGPPPYRPGAPPAPLRAGENA